MINIYTSKLILRNIFHCQVFRINVLVLFIFLLLSGQLNSQTLSAEQIYEKVKDAVVVILAYDNSDVLTSQGSGVVLNDKGYVVTNYHVLEGNERLEIMHSEEIIPYVDIIGIDVEKDILILKIEEKKFPSVKTGNTKALKIGQSVYAIGSPLGYENTISEGIVSGLRSYDEIGRNFIQITASISPGSSGGAVLNSKGELIGISTSSVDEGQNLNFAIPIDDVLSVEISSYSKNDEYKNFEWFAKGYAAHEKGNYLEAIKYYTSYISKYPNDGGAYNNRGGAKARLEDYEGAIQDYNKAIDINPNLGSAYSNRGLAKNGLNDYRGAIQDYNKAIDIDPNDVAAYNNRGLAKLSLKDYRGAIQDYNKGIEINPNYANAFDNRGIAKAKLEDLQGAIRDFNQAIEINSKYAGAYLNRGSAKYQLGDKSGACLDWSKAGELGDDFAYDLIREYCN